MPVSPSLARFRARQWVFAYCVSFAGAVSGCSPSGCAPASPDDRLNVVVVLADAMRAASLPPYGYPRPTTPNLEALAREGVVFDHHFAHYPGTPVSVSQMQTGRLTPPLLVGYKYMAVPVRGIPADLLVLPDAFRQAGYLTGLVSSHYLFREETELVRRFEKRAILPATADRAYAFFEELWPALNDFLDAAQSARQPFYLYVHTLDTHGPYHYHAGFDQYRDAPDWPEAYNRYDSEIMYTDHWIGRLVDELRERGVLHRTVVVVTSDHGEQFNEMGPEKWHSHHGPLVPRALTHIPMIVRIPGDPAPGRRYGGVTRHIDLAPTLLGLAAPGTDRGRYRIDGDDLSAELRKGGTGAGRSRTSIAFSPRYWGIYTATTEVHYDQWSDTFSPLYRPVPDARNYPRLEAIDDGTTREALIVQLREAYEDATRDELALPDNPALPQPAFLGALLPVKPGTASVPTFEDRADDHRWAAGSTGLTLQPGERPAPLTLATPWVPGRYRVSVQLYQNPIRDRGYQNRFTLRLPNGDNRPVRLSGTGAAPGSPLDAGEYDLGRELTIELSEPEGGVAIGGFRFDRVDRSQPLAADDPALKERLRALGYVHE